MKRTPDIYSGNTFGKLTVIGEAPQQGYHRRFYCVCSCGVSKEMYLSSIKAGAQSCGCLQREVATTHGQSNSGNPLYRTWSNMKSRCYDPNAKYFAEYGGRGITVCPEWIKSFEEFHIWAKTSGYKPELTLDRIDNSKGYSPDNCQWVNRIAQQRNRRSHKGSTSKYIGVSYVVKHSKWIAGIKVEGKTINLGLHTNEIDAAISRDQYIVDNNLQYFTMNNVL